MVNLTSQDGPEEAYSHGCNSSRQASGRASDGTNRSRPSTGPFTPWCCISWVEGVGPGKQAEFG